MKSKSKKDRRKCKEATNKKPEVSKHSFRSRRLEVIWLRERTRQATETREGRGSFLSPRVSSLRDRSFLSSYYFIAPTLCRLSKTGQYLWPKEMTWLWDQNDTSLHYACAEVLTRTKNCPWSPQSHSQSSSYSRNFSGECGYHCPRLWLCARVRYSPCLYLRGLLENGVAQFVALLLYTLDVGRQLLLAWPSHLYLSPWRRKAVPSEILVTKNIYSRFW